MTSWFKFSLQKQIAHPPFCSLTKPIFLPISKHFNLQSHFNCTLTVSKYWLTLYCGLSYRFSKHWRKTSSCIRARGHPLSVSLWKDLAPRVEESPDTIRLTRSRLLVRVVSRCCNDKDSVKLTRSEAWWTGNVERFSWQESEYSRRKVQLERRKYEAFGKCPIGYA